jgi:hypothetical protein
MRRRMMRVMSAQKAASAAPGSPPPEQYVLLGGDGSPVVKLKQSDANRIQQEEGEAPEDLEDSDLADAMKELGIQSQPLTDDDRKALGMAPAGQPAAPAGQVATPPAPAPPAASSTSMEAQLQQLAGMRDKGLITSDDYEAKKKQILGL